METLYERTRATVRGLGMVGVLIAVVYFVVGYVTPPSPMQQCQAEVERTFHFGPEGSKAWCKLVRAKELGFVR